MSVRFAERTAQKVRAIAALEHRTFAETVRLLAEEAIKMREFPGVFFIDGPTGRRAVVWGGPDVWELIEPYILADKDWSAFQGRFPELDEAVLRTALRYYAAYPEEIDARIALNQAAWD